jgi:hypothetical protein
MTIIIEFSYTLNYSRLTCYFGPAVLHFIAVTRTHSRVRNLLARLGYMCVPVGGVTLPVCIHIHDHIKNTYKYGFLIFRIVTGSHRAIS